MTPAYIVEKVNNHKYVAEDIIADGYLDYTGKILNKYYNDKNKVSRLLKLGTLDAIGYHVEPSLIWSKFKGGESELHEYLESHTNSEKQYDKLHDEAFSDKYTVSVNRDEQESFNKPKVFKSYHEFLKAMPTMDAGYFYLYENGHWYDIFDGNLGDLTHAKLTIPQAIYDTKKLDEIRIDDFKLRNQNLVNDIKMNIIWLKVAHVSRENIAYHLERLSRQIWNMFCDYGYDKETQSMYFKAYNVLVDKMDIYSGKITAKLTGAKKASTEKNRAIERLLTIEDLIK